GWGGVLEGGEGGVGMVCGGGRGGRADADARPAPGGDHPGRRGYQLVASIAVEIRGSEGWPVASEDRLRPLLACAREPRDPAVFQRDDDVAGLRAVESGPGRVCEGPLATTLEPELAEDLAVGRPGGEDEGTLETVFVPGDEVGPAVPVEIDHSCVHRHLRHAQVLDVPAERGITRELGPEVRMARRRL